MQNVRFPWRSTAMAAASLLLVACLATTPLLAQSSGATLRGTVTDQQNAALPGVTVTAKDEAAGFERVSLTDGQGEYRFPTLPVGVYTIEAQLEGFSTALVKDVRLSVAQNRTLDIQLSVASVEEVITVSDTAPLVRTEVSGGTVISPEELENLPLNGRQFANLGTLAAGTTLGFNTDPTKPGQMVIAMNGGIGRNVNYMVDGGDNMDDTIGGALQNYSVEAVEEFSIQTQQYKAEFGRSTGGVLTVVTKRGTNEFNGSVFDFSRDDSLNSKSESEKQAGVDKQDYSRDQYGASLGGPIVRDKAHFFVTYEKTERDTKVATNTGGIFPALDGSTTDVPFTDELGTGKLTWDINPKQYLQLRYGYQKNTDKYNAVPNSTPDNFGTLINENESLLLGLQSQLGSNAFNEAHVQWSQFDNAITSDSTNPTIYFPGGVITGQNGNTPQSTNQEKRQFKDDFSFSTVLGGSSHDFKAGLEYVDEPELGGDFPSGLNGLYTASQDNVNSPITDIVFFSGSFNFSTPNEQWRAYFQDDWKLNDRLTLNLGFRYDYTDVLELDQRSNAIWQTLSTQTQYNEYYLRDFQGGKGGQIEADDDDWSVRLGFTWDATGEGKHILRGGYGRFYDFPYTNATVLFPTAAVVSLFGVSYQHTNPAGIRNPDGTIFHPGDPLPPNQVPNTGLEPAPNEIASPTLSTPYSDQFSLGWSWQINPFLGLSVEALSIDYEDIPFRFRANPFVDDNGDGVVDHRRFPEFGNFRLWYGGGEASYDALNLSLRGRVQDKFQFQAFYTYSEAEGNVLAGADEFRLTDAGHQADLGGGRRDVSVNPLDPLCNACFGPLNTDSRHRVTLSGIYYAPWGINLASVFRYRSATPYTAHLGFDANHDGFNLDLAAGDHVNSKRGSSFTQLDLRVSKSFHITGDLSIEVIAEVFNVFNDDNPAGFVGNRSAGNFGQPTVFAGDAGQSEQRVGQLGLRLRF